MTLPSVWQGQGRTLLLRLVLNGLLQAGVTVATALLVKLTFDSFITHPPVAPEDMPEALQSSWRSSLAWIAAGFLAIAALGAALRLKERTDAERLGQHYVHRLRLGLFRHLSQLPPRTLQRRSHGGTLLRFVGDLSAIRQWVSLGLARLLVAGIAITATLIALAFHNGLLALMVGAILALGTLGSLALGKSLQAAVREARRRRARLAGNINEKIQAMAVVQVCGQTRREEHRLERQSQRLKEAMVARARVIGRLRAVTEATTSLATAAALLLGVAVVASGQATPGMVVAVMSVVGLLMPPLRDLGRVHEYWQNARVARQKLLEFLSLPAATRHQKRKRRGPETACSQGLLEFRRASVQGVLEEFSATARPGQVIAVVGPNGAGKSTLLALAAGLMEPDRGRVRLDGRSIAKLPPRALRRAVGMVGPDLPLLRGTIERNLRYRWPQAPAAEIERVKHLCGLDEWLARLPEGDQTRLHDAGLDLSAGQRQRIALARAILGNPPLLLLDEADAHLDPAARKIFERVVANYPGTVLMVSHHPDHIRLADEVWHLRAGRLVEQGAPDALLREGQSATARLFRKVHVLAS